MTRIAVFGKTGVGKSQTANSILDINEFQASCRGSSVTKTCQCVTRDIFGKSITIVDTPGIFDTDGSVNMRLEIEKCFQLSSPGPHIILLVASIGRSTKEDFAAINKIRNFFGKEMDKHVIFVFTRFDDLKRDQVGEQENMSHIDMLPAEFQKYIRNCCKNRYILFDNTLMGMEAKEQTLNLISIVDQILNENKGEVYTHYQYQQKKEEERKKRQEEERIRELERQRKRQEEERLKEEERQRIRCEEELKIKAQQEIMKADRDAQVKREEEEAKLRLEIQEDEQRKERQQEEILYNRPVEINAWDILRTALNVTVTGIRVYSIFTGRGDPFRDM